MPYAARKEGDGFVVVNTETNEVKATHSPPDAEEKAKRQAELLNTIEKDPAWDAEESENG